MSENNMKLFKITLQRAALGDFYVIAGDPAKAYDKVKAELDEKKIGFPDERKLKTAELVAESDAYTKLGRLFDART